MPTKYLVLRANRPEKVAQLELAVRGGGTFSSGMDGDDLSIQTFDGHETDAGDLREDPQNVSVLDAEILFTLIKPTATLSADPGQPNAAHLKAVGVVRMPPGLVAVGAHSTSFTGQGVTVAVLDTGIDTQHPAFSGKALVTRDFTGEGTNEADVSDRHGHGTHCAGTICGAPVGDLRVGVAPGVTKLCVGKVLGAAGGGTAEMLLKGLLWAVVEQKAAVVSMSLGYDLPGNVGRLVANGMDATQAAAAALRQQADLIRSISALRLFLETQSPNAVFVAATGNESRRPAFVLDAGLPASELFGVGAVGLDGATPEKWSVASFSNGRAQIVAPGVDVVSAAPGGAWATMSGTSMATPHAAGVAATWYEKVRSEGGLIVPDAVRAAMKASATRQPLSSKDLSAIGAGMVQCPP